MIFSTPLAENKMASYIQLQKNEPRGFTHHLSMIDDNV